MSKLVVMLFCLVLTAVGCSSPEASGGGGGDAALSESSPAGSGTVQVDDFSFAPETVSAAAGDEITWDVVEGSSDHTVKFEDEESDTLAAGDTYSRTFDEAGDYSYVCGIHPQMAGSVTVE